MPCYSPIFGYIGQLTLSNFALKSGLYEPVTAVVFGSVPSNYSKNYSWTPQKFPCSRCEGCLLERSRQWAVRCMHEAKMHRDNCVITLTFNDEHLPKDGNISIDHVQKFMKRLRINVLRTYGKAASQAIRVYYCGEYGEKFGRPHYHACIFGFDFPDKKLDRVTPAGSRLYRSVFLEKCWTFGFSSVGDFSFESAAYVARYVMKKKFGKDADMHYRIVDEETGEILRDVTREFTGMSRRPGIGRSWYDSYKSDIYPNDILIVNGRKTKPPRYYDTLYASENPAEMESIKFQRYIDSLNSIDDNTPERLQVKREVCKAMLSRLKRSLM